jgi:hypothetical protein
MPCKFAVGTVATVHMSRLRLPQPLNNLRRLRLSQNKKPAPPHAPAKGFARIVIMDGMVQIEETLCILYVLHAEGSTLMKDTLPNKNLCRLMLSGDFDQSESPHNLMEYEYCATVQDVEKHLKNCEGRHFQQAAYSTFHTSLTQVCFVCKKVRSNILPKLNR